ncbi:MAG: L-serine ammonia-lyase [Rhodobacteraceae bacterium]|nr:L-serine ammonia-lyase [Paracoccaceae bacterium]
MFVSVFDIFKVGLGPSSSHTMGPMVAAGRFMGQLCAQAPRAHRIRASLYGSLALTGVGHATDRAVILGLAGFAPATYDQAKAETALAAIDANRRLTPDGLPPLHFDPKHDLRFDFGPPLDGHPNGMRLAALDSRDQVIFQETYYSIGGGFVMTDAELAQDRAAGGAAPRSADVPYPFTSAAMLLEMTARAGCSIAALQRANEVATKDADTLRQGCARLWDTMNACIERGLATEGVLPGGLHVRRRAARLYEALCRERRANQTPPHSINDWICAYALAVNEENAAGGQVVTAPTNGAAGVLPGVLRYWLDHVPGASVAGVEDFLLTAAAIGGLIKFNASISGAEAGCQAEVGSAASMAAAGLCAVLGGTPQQVENAAEIALEHHLGMTCDPIKGLVQVPCIERNGLGAIKAVSAASLALRGDGVHLVSLDVAIRTMRETGRDMQSKYKETSQGGLAAHLPNC